ncbi:MAG TPA: SLBB domain-containing protein [Bryobacteraceae bacterium]|nr:SLBB domain-containing protein [Bryobacteraceae bacterium]
MTSHLNAWFRQPRRIAAAALLCLAGAHVCFSQSMIDEKPADAVAQQSASPTNTATANSESSSADVSMPTEALIQVLRNNPQIMVEVKSVIADDAQQRGVSIQPDALTDQQVYSQLETSATLRASVTEFLRARGYISEADIEHAGQAYQRSSGNPAAGASSASRASNEANPAIGAGGDDEEDFAADKLNLLTDVPPGAATSPQKAGATRSMGESARPNITDEPSALHRSAPYNLRALRDLYSQVPDSPGRLKRFGSGLFTNRNAQAPDFASSGRASTLDVPLGPDYVLGPGDELSIALWGGVSQTIVRRIDRNGGLSLPDAGPMQIAGLTLGDAQSLIGNAMRSQYRNAHVVVTVAQVRSIRIFVVGDVQRPGAYEVSALASPLIALFDAGGPTAAGSLRILRHFRNQQPIGEIDLYDFMLHGVRPTDDRLEAGDTLLVPPVGPQVAIFGAVKRPAIYELKNEKDLAAVLGDAGGLTVAASLAHITIERVVPHREREEVAVVAEPGGDPETTISGLRSTEVKDGDRIHVGTVLPYNEKVVYLQGHVARPGKFAFHEGMRIGDLLRSYQDLLPEPADRGEIVRLVAPDLHPETIEFSVPEVLIGNTNMALQPFDTIRIFGRYELDAPMVSVRGEVERPGKYPMFKGMTAAELVRTAGGFKRDALLSQADLASYRERNGTRVVVQRQDVAIGDAVAKSDHAADVALRAGDVLTIHRLTGWDDIGASIVIEGEVAHPGSYSFNAGEHLSDVLRRAGGFRQDAYPAGAVLTRPEVAALETKSRQELIAQIEASAASARISPGAGDEKTAALKVIQQQQDQIVSQLQSEPVTGRLVVHIESDIDRWAGTPVDIEVRNGDTLRIPKRPGFVLVSGQVYSPAAITFMPGRTAGWYLERAGGATSIANRKEIFIVRANGSVIGRSSQKWFARDVLSTRLDPGDTIVVPQKIIGPSITWRNLLGTAQVVTSLAIAAAVAGL